MYDEISICNKLLHLSSTAVLLELGLTVTGHEWTSSGCSVFFVPTMKRELANSKKYGVKMNESGNARVKRTVAVGLKLQRERRKVKKILPRARRPRRVRLWRSLKPWESRQLRRCARTCHVSAVDCPLEFCDMHTCRFDTNKHTLVISHDSQHQPTYSWSLSLSLPLFSISRKKLNWLCFLYKKRIFLTLIVLLKFLCVRFALYFWILSLLSSALYRPTLQELASSMNGLVELDVAFILWELQRKGKGRNRYPRIRFYLDPKKITVTEHSTVLV